MKSLTFALGLLLLSRSAFAFPEKPNDTNIPHFCSKSSPDFQEYRYASKTAVCKRNVLDSIKTKVYKDYAIPTAEQKDYTVDHLVPLFLGGSNHRLNLWPQHKSISTATKEGQLFRDLSAGRAEYQDALKTILLIKFKKSE